MSENENLFEMLPAELKRIILHQLSLQDLLNLSLVSKSFYEFIGKSHDCMKQIWIKFYTFKLKDLESLSVSSRNYEKLKVNRVKSDEHFKFLIDLEKSWKKVLIYNTMFKGLVIFAKLIEAFSESVEELEISDIEVSNQDWKIEALKFLNLKRLMLRNVPATTIESFLAYNKNLESVALDIVQILEGKTALEDLMDRLLMNSAKLTHLQLGAHYIKPFFDRENANMAFEFKLRTLMLKFSIIPDESEEIARNVSSFLLNQPKITWIVFLELQSEEILTTSWNKLPELERLTFVGLEGLFNEEMDLAIEVNEKITQVELISWRVLISQVRKILSSAPRLKILHVHTLTKYIMEFTSRNHQMIRELRYETLDDDVEETYKNLKIENENVNQLIELKKMSFWWDAAKPFTLDPIFWHS